MIKCQIRQLSSRDRSGRDMYPGQWLFTWQRIGAVWYLLSIEAYVPPRVDF